MKRILLIESDPFLSLLLLKRLRQLRFEVRHASHTEEAWRFMEMERPDAILTELVLPRKDGFEFLEELRAHPRFADLEISVHTRLGSREDIHRCQELGVRDYFIKSHHTPDEVVAALLRAWTAESVSL